MVRGPHLWHSHPSPRLEHPGRDRLPGPSGASATTRSCIRPGFRPGTRLRTTA